ncbi:MAG: type II toxin-antitoxin system VapB family antitoxin [Candidatus Saccharibacteria bacterium]|nr:type II toxin-antitoxin system VapB family antitoxin [Rhodoferax sp.]
MRTTLTKVDDLFAKAMALADPGIDKSDLLRECVKAFIHLQSSRRLAMGGKTPEIK